MDNKTHLRQFIEDIWNGGKLELIDHYVADAYTIHHDPGDQWAFQTLDHKQFKARVMYSRNAFPDLRFLLQDVFDIQDSNTKVLTTWRLRGTQQGELARIPATGKQIDISGMTIYYFLEGKITGHWQQVDRFAAMQQLGSFEFMSGERR